MDKSDKASVVVFKEYHSDHKPDPVFVPSRVIVVVHGLVVLMDGTSDQAGSDELELYLEILPNRSTAGECSQVCSPIASTSKRKKLKRLGLGVGRRRPQRIWWEPEHP